MFHVTCVTRDFTSGLRLWQWQSCRNYGVTCSSSKLQSYVSTHGVFSRMHGTTIITHLKLQCMRKWWLNCSCKSRIALVALQVSCFWLTSCKQQTNIIQFILAGSMFHPIMLRLDAHCEQFYGKQFYDFPNVLKPCTPACSFLWLAIAFCWRHDQEQRWRCIPKEIIETAAGLDVKGGRGGRIETTCSDDR